MVLVPLKKSLTLYFARVCLYCSLRSLMYGMTSLGWVLLSVGFLSGFALLKELCWIMVVL